MMMMIYCMKDRWSTTLIKDRYDVKLVTEHARAFTLYVWLMQPTRYLQATSWIIHPALLWLHMTRPKISFTNHSIPKARSSQFSFAFVVKLTEVSQEPERPAAGCSIMEMPDRERVSSSMLCHITSFQRSTSSQMFKISTQNQYHYSPQPLPSKI